MNILVAYKHYPLTLASYQVKALRQLGHNLWKVGSYFSTIPWNTKPDYARYQDVPDFVTPDVESFPIDLAIATCAFKPDLVINFDSVYSLAGKNHFGIPQAIVLVDPHCLREHYRLVIGQYDGVFCMQRAYMDEYSDLVLPERFHWLPFAYDPQYHYPVSTPFSQRPYHVGILSALLYPQRVQCLAYMEAMGLNIRQDSGILFDEVADWYGDVVMAFNAASRNDLPARVWEGWGTGNLVLTNNCPDLQFLPEFREGEDYVGFDTPEECAEKANYYVTHLDEAEKIARQGHATLLAHNHTWVDRMKFLLEKMGMN